MKVRRWVGPFAAVTGLLWSQTASADCTVTSVTSVSPALHNVGTYGSGSSRPGNTTRTLTLTVQAVGINNTNTGNNCDVRVNLRRAASPAALSTPGGPVTLPYSATISGDAMIFGATAVPNNPAGPGNPTGTLSGTLVLGSARPMTISATLAVTPGTPASTPIVGTGYSDDLFLDIYNWPNSVTAPNRRVLVGSLPLSLTATVTQSCTIVPGSAANTNQTITIGPNGATTGGKTGGTPSFNVNCTGRSNVSLTSQNGGVTRGGVLASSLGPAPTGFRNKINYTASVTGGAGGTVTLNTASSSTSGLGAFNNAAVTGYATTVAISPEASAIPLLAGGYSDVLTVSVVPQ